ncbi:MULTISPECIES: SAM-dependent methyltransferase [unclassified Nocardiopsis]|uniref:SAM-dependent methyltransferase n=1 Tax=unclassified Nocardiopsis TaxID=2649073 RepID=UPI00135A7641|nr:MULTISPECIES: SAM-dependent methyltransferase [unclassified Nocardiopsis]
MSTPPPVDTAVAHSARVWNYWLGGRDHHPVDRETGDRIAEVLPEIVDIVLATRSFRDRVVSHLVEREGVTQFLDIGTGLPTAHNTHEAAQAAEPAARVLYVDHDPLVKVRARALLTGTPEGATGYLHADLRDPAAILAGAARTLDPTRPVAVVLLGVLPFVGDDGEAARILDHLMGALAPGSFLALTHSTCEATGPRAVEAVRRWNEAGDEPYRLRTPEEVRGLFAGLDLVEPGVVPCPLWRPVPAQAAWARPMDEYGGLARRP